MKANKRTLTAVTLASGLFLTGGVNLAFGQSCIFPTYPEPLNNNAATDSGGDYHPQVTTDGAGNWVAVWHSTDDLGLGLGTDEDILVARSVDNGVTWTDPAPLNNNAATDSGRDYRPQVTTDGAGNWVAVWDSSDDLGLGLGTDVDILVVRSVDNGVTWTDPAPLNNNAFTDSGHDYDPQVTTDGAGNWVAVWISSDDLGGTIGNDYDILVARSVDNGATWTDPAPLNNNAATDSGDDYYPQMTTDGAGNWVAVWDSNDDLGLGLGTDFDILVARSADNGLTWTDPAPLNNNAATDSENDRYPQVTTDGAENWLAVWHSWDDLGGTIGNDADILVAHSVDNGLTWTDPAPLNDNAATDSGGDSWPQVITDEAGNWVAVWSSSDDLGGTIGTDADILVARSIDNGVTWTGPAPLNNNADMDSGVDWYPQLTTDEAGNWVAVWYSQDDFGGTIGIDQDILVARAHLGPALYVDANATGPTHDGSSWCDAYQTLDEALDVSTNGTTIRVAEGTYTPNTNGLADPREATFQLIDCVRIEGGYAGCGAPDPDERDVDSYETTLSGDLSDNDDPGDFPGGVSFSDNSYHVVTGSGTDPTAVIDGFTITAGNADGTDPDDRGGGMYNYGGSPTVANCTFTVSFGGAGGGMFNEEGSNPTLTNCTFNGNTAGDEGGALANTDCDAELTNCIFTGNSAGTDGGAVANDNCNAELTNCIFVGNQAGDDGGAISNWACDPIVTNCTIVENIAYYDGGGIEAVANAHPSVANCVFWGNGDGGGVDESAQLHHSGISDYAVSHSLIEGLSEYVGSGNTDDDPMFLREPDNGGDGWGVGDNDDYGDLRVRAGSPCIDAGSNGAVPSEITTDLDGNPRFVDDPTVEPDPGAGTPPIVDMGAYEYQADCNTNGVIDSLDIAGATSEDCNTNGVPDECDIAEAASDDYDDNGVPDECDPDCNENDVPDPCDLDCGTGNCAGHPGGCGTSDDCQLNNIPDECDITGTTSDDYDDNGVPDECDPDCNENDVPDPCDLDCGTGNCAGHPGGCGCSEDCQTNGVPDECDMESGTSENCNGNDTPDECDIAAGTSEDCQSNGTPDECDLLVVDNDCDNDGIIDACQLYGFAGDEFGSAISVQDTQTGFGDSNLGLVDFANGSELDAVYASIRGDVLYLVLAGNLESNFNKFEVFIDSIPGEGQNRLRGDNPDIDFDGLNRMGDDGSSNGLTFDVDFAPDYFLSFTGGNDPYDLYGDYAELLTGGGGVGYYLGQGGAADVSDGGLAGGTEPQPMRAIRATIDNSNTNGVTAGTGLDSGAGVRTGLELTVPLAAIGSPGGSIKVCAFINGSSHDWVSNQVLGPIGGGGNLGEPRDVNFQTVAGDQYFFVPAEQDCNLNGLCDVCELAHGLAEDCNSNGIPDECDIAACMGDPDCGDCNNNGVPDACDIAAGTSLDVSPADGVPDECVEWDGSEDEFWSNPYNWEDDDVPGDSGPGPVEHVVIEGGGRGLVILDIIEGVSVDSLVLGTGSTLEISAGDLSIDSPNGIRNDGIITVDDAQAIIATTAMGITGTQAIELSGATAALTSSAPGDTITNSTTIEGQGVIDADLLNEGAVVANVASETLSIEGPNTKINNGSFQATDAATLLITNTAVGGTGAYLADGGTIALEAGGGSASIAGATLDVLNSNGVVEVYDDASINLSGEATIGINGTYQGVGVTSASLAAGSVLISGDGINHGGQMTLTSTMNVIASGSITVDGGVEPGGKSQSRGCTPPVLLVTGSAELSGSLMEIIGGGVVEMGDNAVGDMSGSFSMDTAGVFQGVAGSSATLSAGGVSIANGDSSEGGQMLLDDNMSAHISGDVSLVCSDCERSPRGCTPPVLLVAGAAELEILEDFVLNGDGEVFVGSSEAVVLGGDFVNHSRAPFAFDWVVGGLIMDGDFADRSIQVFEVAGTDVGASTNGMSNNFALGELEVASASEVSFVDTFDNNQLPQMPCGEALYVHTLVLRSGSSIDLNNCRVYCIHLLDEGGTTITTSGCGELRVVPTGDFDGDGEVGLSDFAAFEECLGGPGEVFSNPSCGAGDFDTDSDVDLEDFGEFQEAFGGS